MDKKIPKFSVISVCWNEGENIRPTCESVCQQDYENFEWIVIDGGSTDTTLHILEEYASDIATLVTEPDKGIYNAMNKGILFARGEYLVFINGGDQFHTKEALSIIAAAPQMDIIFGDLIMTRSDGTEALETFPNKLPPDYLLWGWLPHPASFIKHRLFKENGVYDESFRIAGDYDLFTRFLVDGSATYHHINVPLAKFSMGGISSDPSFRNMINRERHLIRKKYFSSYRFSFKGMRRGIRSFFAR